MSYTNSNSSYDAEQAAAAMMFIIALAAIALVAALMPIFYPIAAIVLIIEGAVVFSVIAGLIELLWTSPDQNVVIGCSAVIAAIACLASAYSIVTNIEFKVSENPLYERARLMWRVSAAAVGALVFANSVKSSWGLNDIAVVLSPIVASAIAFAVSRVDALSMRRSWMERS